MVMLRGCMCPGADLLQCNSWTIQFVITCDAKLLQNKCSCHDCHAKHLDCNSIWCRYATEQLICKANWIWIAR